MALSFAKKAVAQSAPTEQNEAPKTEQKSSSTMSKFGKSNVSSSPKSVSFLKTGAAAKQAIAEADAAAELRKQEAGKMFDFWLNKGEERTITFLDGDLDAEGMLDVNMFHQHTVKVNGDWQDFPCVGEHEPCPICEKGENRSTLVGLFTVIDHTPYKIKKGKNAGKTVENQRKLFFAKHETMSKLTKQASKRGGSLAGCTFEVSRSESDSAARVGDTFEFVKRYESYEELAEAYSLKLEEVQPANYEDEITYYSADELVEMGVGKATKGIGHEKGIDTKKLKDEL